MSMKRKMFFKKDLSIPTERWGGHAPPKFYSMMSTVTRILFALDANSFANTMVGIHGSGANAICSSNTTHPYTVCLELSARVNSRVSEIPVG